MVQKILVISGKKESGKTSLANFLTGYEMRRNNVIKAFDVTEDGQLLVPTMYQDIKGDAVEGSGVVDLTRTDLEFFEWAAESVWPYVKIYNLADRLKQIVMIVFGVEHQQLYGTNADKETPTKIKWSNFRDFLSPERQAQISVPLVNDRTFEKYSKWDTFMTGRDIAQVFGSEVCRRLCPECWYEACYRDIESENAAIAVVADGRFPNELDYMREKGAKVVRLTRNIHNDTHESETALDNYTGYDLVIDNQNMTLEKKNWALLEALLKWGWISSLD